MGIQSVGGKDFNFRINFRTVAAAGMKKMKIKRIKCMLITRGCFIRNIPPVLEKAQGPESVPYDHKSSVYQALFNVRRNNNISIRI
jgi:hypothetical protein